MSSRTFGRKFQHGLRLVGLDPSRTWQTMSCIPGFFASLRKYRKLAGSNDSFPVASLFPMLGEANVSAGQGRGHYFHQDLLVAQWIHERKPRRHIDVGSRIDGFVAHVAAFRPIDVIDIRPLTDVITNVDFLQCDVMGHLPTHLHRSTDSLSCLHALEHFGLGRYGDPLDPLGWRKGFDNLASMIAPGGWFYLSVPIGPQRTEFNAHRVFSIRTLLDLFARRFTVRRFAVVGDDDHLRMDVPLSAQVVENNAGCVFGCGIFEAQAAAE
jgi:hypothetical protein